MLPLSSDDGDGLRVATARGGGETERESEGNARRIERRQASGRRGEREGVGGKERVVLREGVYGRGWVVVSGEGR